MLNLLFVLFACITKPNNEVACFEGESADACLMLAVNSDDPTTSPYWAKAAELGSPTASQPLRSRDLPPPRHADKIAQGQLAAVLREHSELCRFGYAEACTELAAYLWIDLRMPQAARPIYDRSCHRMVPSFACDSLDALDESEMVRADREAAWFGEGSLAVDRARACAGGDKEQCVVAAKSYQIACDKGIIRACHVALESAWIATEGTDARDQVLRDRLALCLGPWPMACRTIVHQILNAPESSEEAAVVFLAVACQRLDVPSCVELAKRNPWPETHWTELAQQQGCRLGATELCVGGEVGTTEVLATRVESSVP